MKHLNKAARAIERQSHQKGIAGKNLWCVVALDGAERVWTFCSGKGFEGIPVDRGNNHDAEERMAMHFPNMIAEHGRAPASIQMITRATPCRQLCTEILRALAATYPSIAMITIASWEDYKGQTAEQTAQSKIMLNDIVRAANFDVEVRLENSRNITWDMLMPRHP